MKLYVTRHGETPMNAAHRVCGLTNVDLTEKGIAQAKEAGRSLQDKGIKRIIASPLLRAQHTAKLRCTETFDIAFLDPPYRTGTLTKALLAVTPHMNRGGIVICEHPTDEELPETAGEFVRVRDYRYGKILLTAYRHQSMV